VAPVEVPTALPRISHRVKIALSAVFLTLAGATAYDVSRSTDEDPGVIQAAVNLKEGLISGDVKQIIEAEAAAQGVDVNLVKALVWTESSFNTHALSSADCRGLGQLNPRFFPLNDYRDPAENIRATVKELARLLGKYSLEDALNAYNAGEGNMLRGDASEFVETQNHAERILRRKAILDASGL
jgi:soluble lytic murein transglycosylase-like protein